MIYLDAAATSFQKPPTVMQAVCQSMQTMGSPGRGAHPISLAASRTVYQCRVQLAQLFGAPDPARVCFTANATQALNTVLCGLFQPGDHIITTALEHNSVLRPLYRLQSQGMMVSILPVDAQGKLDYDLFAAALRPQTRAVVCIHASNVTGNALDLGRIGAFCRSHGLLLIVDAAQSAGVLSIDMVRDGISVVCFAGHKGLFGPQGTGGLCVMPGIEIAPFAIGGTGVHSFDTTQPIDYPERLEAGTLNTAGIAGLSAGLAFIATTGLETIHAHERALEQRFYRAVRNLPGIIIYGDPDATLRTAVISLNLQEEDASTVSDVLAQEFGICTRAGAHCAPLVHKALGTVQQGAVRFSFSYFNTPDEVDAAIDALSVLAGRSGG